MLRGWLGRSPGGQVNGQTLAVSPERAGRGKGEGKGRRVKGKRRVETAPEGAVVKSERLLRSRR